MAPDGTITLHLTANDDAALEDAMYDVRPGDPQYDEILGHIGGLRPGEEKLVPPWPR